jgi:hypothetical protein
MTSVNYIRTTKHGYIHTSNILFSIIIPAYNEESNLENLLEELLIFVEKVRAVFS